MAEIVRAGMAGVESPGPVDTLWSRRDFFSITGWAGLTAAIGVGTLAFTRFMFPRILFEPNPIFAAGRPDEYVAGVVDERLKLVLASDGQLVADKSAVFRMRPGPADGQYPQSLLRV